MSEAAAGIPWRSHARANRARIPVTARHEPGHPPGGHCPRGRRPVECCAAPASSHAQPPVRNRRATNNGERGAGRVPKGREVRGGQTIRPDREACE